MFFFFILSRCCHIFFLLALFSRKNLLSSLNVVLCTKCIFINSGCFYNFFFIASFEGFDHDVPWFSYPHICCFGDLLGLDVYPHLPTLHFRNSDFAHWTARCPSSLLVLFSFILACFLTLAFFISSIFYIFLCQAMSDFLNSLLIFSTQSQLFSPWIPFSWTAAWKVCTKPGQSQGLSYWWPFMGYLLQPNSSVFKIIVPYIHLSPSLSFSELFQIWV